MSPSRSFLVLLAAVALLPGCKRKEIRVYTAPKDPPQATKSAEEQPANLPHEQRPEVAYEKPASWSPAEQDAVSVVNFVIDTDKGHATVNVTPLGDFAGQEAMFVNMWREQIGLPSLSGADAEKALSPIKVGGRDGKIFEITGTVEDKTRKIVTAIVERPGATWFYKLAGDEAVVDAQKPTFLSFIQTVRLASEPAPKPEAASPAPTVAEAAPPAPASAEAPVPAKASAPAEAPTPAEAPAPTTASAPIPPPAAPAPPTPPPAEPAAESKAAAVPAGWRAIQPGPMQAAKFAVPDQGAAKAEVSVSVFGSDTGGPLANINRWRGQVGLDPVDEAGLAGITKPIPGLEGSILADFSKENRRMVGAIVPRAGRWWFYKLLGDADAVAAAPS
jgi:hypothetical protein